MWTAGSFELATLKTRTLNTSIFSQSGIGIFYTCFTHFVTKTTLSDLGLKSVLLPALSYDAWWSILKIRRRQSTHCQTQLKNKTETKKEFHAKKKIVCNNMTAKPFLKFIHSWISLCVLPLSSCSGSKDGTLMSANLLRKTTKRNCFFAVSLKDYTSHSSGLWRDLAAGFPWKETTRVWNSSRKT